MIHTPRFSKFKKFFRAKPLKRVYKNISYPALCNGSIGLKIISAGLLSIAQLQSVRHVLNKITKKVGKVNIFAFPNATLSSKSIGSRMGKGKSGKNVWVCKLKPGFLFCSINTALVVIAERALKAAQFRMPMATKIIKNNF